MMERNIAVKREFQCCPSSHGSLRDMSWQAFWTFALVDTQPLQAPSYKEIKHFGNRLPQFACASFKDGT